MRLLRARTGATVLGTTRARRLCIPPPPPPPPQQYADLWVSSVEKYSSLTALTFDGAGPAVNISYTELESRVNRLSRNLREKHGVGQGDRIITISENRPELITLMLSCFKAPTRLVPREETARQPSRLIP